uniref:Arginine vasopressin-induced protein 1 n=1 Tax=Fundulus heteroclitus TaxID=8078 RepID=A0A3Q2SQF0_FUNHE
MDTRSASPSPSVVAGPSSLWRLAKRRNRKSGSGNIFSNVNLCQLQKLFRAAGDPDATQRAQLVWGQKDEAELAQALIALRSRGHRRGHRTNGKDTLGLHWLRAFNHLRYSHFLAILNIIATVECLQSYLQFLEPQVADFWYWWMSMTLQGRSGVMLSTYWDDGLALGDV